jgi:hypothetical protein
MDGEEEEEKALQQKHFCRSVPSVRINNNHLPEEEPVPLTYLFILYVCFCCIPVSADRFVATVFFPSLCIERTNYSS